MYRIAREAGQSSPTEVHAQRQATLVSLIDDDAYTPDSDGGRRRRVRRSDRPDLWMSPVELRPLR